MNDEPLEPLDIDDGSPGERMIAGGRASVRRIVGDQRLDVAALLWMLCTISSLVVGIYGAFQIPGDAFPGSDGAWYRVAVLSSTGGPTVAFSCIVGIALAVWFDTTAARRALWLATIGGVWIVIAAACSIASTLHDSPSVAFFGNSHNRAVDVIGGVSYAGFGLVVVMIAWRLLERRRQLN